MQETGPSPRAPHSDGAYMLAWSFLAWLVFIPLITGPLTGAINGHLVKEEIGARGTGHVRGDVGRTCTPAEGSMWQDR